MSINAAQLYALVGVTGAGQSVRDLQGVSNQVNRTQGVMAGLGKNAGQIGKGFGQVGAGLLRIAEVAAVAAGGAVIASAKVGTTFQQQMELIHTQAGATQQEVDTQSKAVQALVHSVGVGPEALARAMYHIESVGARGAAALDILKASALGAKVGLADMESVTNALTAVWFSGIKGAKSMTDAMAILDGIVGVGNMHLQDLTDSFRSGILGTAATYGVDIRSLGAAIATLTDAGVPADIAATRLNNTLTHIAAPVKGAIGVLKDLGLGQFDLAKDLRKPDGIFVALKDLHDHLVKAGEIKNGILTPQGAADMSKLFGGSRFGATAMQLLTQMDRVQDKYDLINKRSGTFGENVAKTMETAGFTFAQLKADIEESALAFSDGFLPALARAGKKFDAFLFGHQGDIRKVGIELGQWIDKIDWKQVEDGANSFVGVLRTVLDLVGKIPPQIDLAIVGFLGLNKVSGGLLGKGVENIAGGILGAVGTLGKGALRMGLSKIPVIGGAAAALTSTPVFVTNWPIGFGMGGGVPPAPGVPPVAPAGPTLLSTLGVAAGFAMVAQSTKEALDAAVAANPDKYYFVDPNADPFKNKAENAAAKAATLPTHIGGGLYGIAGGVPVTIADREMDGAGFRRVADASTDAAEKIRSAVYGNGDQQAARTAHALSALGLKISRDLHGLRTAVKPIDIAKFARAIAGDVTKGAGSVKGTGTILKDLRIKLEKTDDPKTRAALKAAIHAVEAKLPGRVHVDQELATARRILASNDSSKHKLADIHAIEKRLRAEGFTHAAAVVKEIARKDLSVTIHPAPVAFNVDGRRIASAMIPYINQTQKRNA